jgi:hypothetical protein
VWHAGGVVVKSLPELREYNLGVSRLAHGNSQNMPAWKHGKKDKGSQHWLQVAANERCTILDVAIHSQIGLAEDETINWISPIAPDYCEYQDDTFLEKLKIDLPKVSLKEFWPDGGPVWDGLGRTSHNKVLLIEAKSHIPEIDSPGSAASPKSLDQIAKSLNQTRAFLDAKPLVDWTRTFFQYTNRIAHLYFLRELNAIDAVLLNVYFLNDTEMHGPSSEEEWKGAITLLKTHLGITRTKLTPHIKDIFIDVNDLKT